MSSTKMVCECGCSIMSSSYVKHQKTKTHLNKLTAITKAIMKKECPVIYKDWTQPEKKTNKATLCEEGSFECNCSCACVCVDVCSCGCVCVDDEETEDGAWRRGDDGVWVWVVGAVWCGAESEDEDEETEVPTGNFECRCPFKESKCECMCVDDEEDEETEEEDEETEDEDDEVWGVGEFGYGGAEDEEDEETEDEEEEENQARFLGDVAKGDDADTWWLENEEKPKWKKMYKEFIDEALGPVVSKKFDDFGYGFTKVGREQYKKASTTADSKMRTIINHRL